MVSEDSFITPSELVMWIGTVHPDAVVYDLNEPEDDHLETYARIAPKKVRVVSSR